MDPQIVPQLIELLLKTDEIPSDRSREWGYLLGTMSRVLNRIYEEEGRFDRRFQEAWASIVTDDTRPMLARLSIAGTLRRYFASDPRWLEVARRTAWDETALTEHRAYAFDLLAAERVNDELPRIESGRSWRTRPAPRSRSARSLAQLTTTATVPRCRASSLSSAEPGARSSASMCSTPSALSRTRAPSPTSKRLRAATPIPESEPGRRRRSEVSTWLSGSRGEIASTGTAPLLAPAARPRRRAGFAAQGALALQLASCAGAGAPEAGTANTERARAPRCLGWRRPSPRSPSICWPRLSPPTSRGATSTAITEDQVRAHHGPGVRPVPRSSLRERWPGPRGCCARRPRCRQSALPRGTIHWTRWPVAALMSS